MHVFGDMQGHILEGVWVCGKRSVDCVCGGLCVGVCPVVDASTQVTYPTHSPTWSHIQTKVMTVKDSAHVYQREKPTQISISDAWYKLTCVFKHFLFYQGCFQTSTLLQTMDVYGSQCDMYIKRDT